MGVLIVNLYGGPGTGKSTTAAATFSRLKLKGINCELVTEFAKDKVWEKSFNVLENQIYITAKQFHRLWKLHDQVDVIVTDSPLLLGLIYGKHESYAFEMMVRDLYRRFDCIDIFLRRTKVYNPKGRVQTEEKAREIDKEIKDIVRRFDLELDADKKAAKIISSYILKKLA